MHPVQPLFGADDNSAYGVAAVAALVTAIGGVLVQYLTTKQTQKVQNEDRSLTEAWKNVEEARKAAADAAKREDDKDKELRQCERALAAARERNFFLEGILRDNKIKIPRRRPQDGGMTDSDYHRSLPSEEKEEVNNDG